MTEQTLALRKQIRSQRRKVSHFEHIKAQRQVLVRIQQILKCTSHQKIGVYLHAFGEIYTDQIIRQLLKQKKQVYLPVICNMNQRLVWIQVSKHQYLSNRFKIHSFGMKEPYHSRGLPVSKLDVILMPLLACDLNGTRMGMGGGYYDRTLAFAPCKPLRIGLGHEFQYLNSAMRRQNWDQPLDLFISPTKTRTFKRKSITKTS